MSAQIHGLVFHPVVSQSLRVWSTTIGRDKTYRAIQYFARFYAWFLLHGGYSESVARWNSLKVALALGRKLMRVFKPLEHLQLALASLSLSTPYALEKYTAAARQFSYAGYLTFDTLVWTNAIRFTNLDPVTAARVNRISQRFWLAGILFSITNGVVKLNRHVSNMKELKKASGSEKREKIDDIPEYRALSTNHSAIRYQLIQDLLDFWLPASNLGYVYISDGLAGIIGVITSIMAFKLQWAAAGKK